ncbi:outer membrane protein/peptidoglycan-associated (lipo)protein [Bernardetia litoralis DSM 6794]|uniref:Outer membrane protein/peptidoglycan-associated (Lipo)protein n=1 Tax=Bernardetia litoralis (strain ATCC 23117 / DSM 6794 / NBRC 15988 / NCIMB 1366 / Fx l1 / Sio-4) TaxID=880071 RepID=I4AMK0_BERLS|nr:OmpA family protein [Bernardetia litoralis]AFM05185.1 outer membrane protein/peptidoglycan-associated (lipo)protein [Bernardetia litoralis DSM 6794]
MKKIKICKNKYFTLFLFVVIGNFIINSSFAQNFDSSENLQINNTSSFAPTSSIVKGKLFAYHHTKKERKEGKTITQKEKLVVNLTVRNLRTQENQKRIFSPDTATGNYFMFLLPNERYEISIQVEGFRPYVIVVFIPPQTFIYELNRDIIFEPIMLLDEQIGQHNFFKNRSQNITNYYDSAAFHNYDKDRFEILRELIDYTMVKGNTDAFDSLERITVNEIRPQTPVQYVSSKTDMSEEFKPIFAKIKESFSHGSWEYIDEFYARQSTGNTYYSTAKSISTTEKENQKTIVTHFVLFDGKNAKRLTREQKGKLKQVATFLNNDPRLAIEIFGRTYSEDNTKQDNSENSLKMSAKRTKQVFKYLKRRVNDKSKFHYIVYGMSEKLDDAILNETIQEEKQNNTDNEELILTQLPPKTPRVELVISLD